jgi:Predicted NADH:ubiquinone oxidoreductase, subunit RnfE
MHEHCGTAVPALPTVGTGPTASEDFLKGIWKENPMLVQLLGGCATLAVTNSVVNGMAMGLATLFVLVGSSVFVSALRKVIPNEVRISTYVLIIATFVTLADIGLEAFTPEIHKALGAFIALIVANCIVLGRQEAFSARTACGGPSSTRSEWGSGSRSRSP